MVDTLPSRQEIEDIFVDCSNGSKELDQEQFKDLCYRLFLAPTNSDVIDLFRMYEKDKLSVDEVSSLIERQWEPIAERKRKFIDDLRTCRKGSSGPLTRDELCEILTKGDEQNHDRLTEEDLIYVFQELSIHEDQLIDEEELTELIFKIEVALSRAQSRLTQHDAEETQDNLDTGEPEGQTQQSEAQDGEPQQGEVQEGEQQQAETQEGQQQQQSETGQQEQAQDTTDKQEQGQTGETTDNGNENNEQVEGQTTETTQQQDTEQDVENSQGEQEVTTEQTPNNDENKQEMEETQGESIGQSTVNDEEKTEEQSQNNVTETQAENIETNELNSQQKSE